MSRVFLQSGENRFVLKPMYLVEVLNEFQSLDSSITVVTGLRAGKLENGRLIHGRRKNIPDWF
jgi:hypothetical protein